MGEGNDSVPELIPGSGAHEFPEEKIILRIRSAIWDKHKKLQNYIQENLVDKNDSYLLAINGGRMGIQAKPYRPRSGRPPIIVKAVFPIGAQYGVWKTKTGEMVDSGFKYRDSVEKKNGSPVSTDVFQDEKYTDISAIIYSGVNCCNYPGQMSGDFQIVHNPMAKQPLEIGAIGLGIEYWLENGEIKSSFCRVQ